MTLISSLRSARLRPISAMLVAALGAGCCLDSPDLQMNFTAEGELVELSTESAIPIAEGSLDRLDRRVHLVVSELGLSPAKLELLVMDKEEELEEICGTRSGCYFPCSEVSVVSRSWTLISTMHELLHQVADKSIVGSTDPLLSEGFASLFGSTYCAEEPNEFDLSKLIGLPSDARLTDSEYTVGAKLLEYLREEFGASAVIDLLSRTSAGDDFNTVDAVFIDTFGRSIAEIESEFDPSAIAFEVRSCANVDPETPVDGVWTRSGPILFDDPDTFNTFSGPESRGLGTEFTIEVEFEAKHVITPAGGPNIHVWINSCSCDQDFLAYNIREESTVLLPAGRFRLVLIDDSGTSQIESAVHVRRS